MYVINSYGIKGAHNNAGLMWEGFSGKKLMLQVFVCFVFEDI